MTMVENKLLRSKRAQTVPQQNVWLARMFVLRDDPKRNHVLDELIKPAGAEFTKTARGFCGQAMTTVVVSVNDKLIFNQKVGWLGIAAYVLTETMSNLNNPARFVMVTPFRAGNREPITACELKSLRCAH